ncbi:MAG TPA: hypothetical protein VHB45_08935 [Alloacidobacterium sp.]|nr:hypothetical protein [Alloacidobacterium sp.]
MIKIGSNDVFIQGRLVKIAHLASDKYEPITSPELIADDLRSSTAKADLFTFMQIMPDRDRRFNFYSEMDNLAVLPVSTFDYWWNSQIRSYPRNRARQAEKRGVTLREVPFDDCLVEGMTEVYNETKVRQGKPNVHYGKDVATVRRESATFLDQSIFIGAFFENKLIGFVKIVVDTTKTQASLMNIVAMVRHRDKAPTNALIAYAVRACSARNIPYLMYQNFVYGNKGADSLTVFKEINGFERVDLPRYYIPLTSLGHAALKFGLHHSLIDQLPKSLALKLRQFRTNWYNRKMNAVADSPSCS